MSLSITKSSMASKSVLQGLSRRLNSHTEISPYRLFSTQSLISDDGFVGSLDNFRGSKKVIVKANQDSNKIKTKYQKRSILKNRSTASGRFNLITPAEKEMEQNMKYLTDCIINKETEEAWNYYVKIVEYSLETGNPLLSTFHHIQMMQLLNLKKLEFYNSEIIQIYESRLEYLIRSFKTFESINKNKLKDLSTDAKQSNLGDIDTKSEVKEKNFFTGILNFSLETKKARQKDNFLTSNKQRIATNINNVDSLIVNHMIEFYIRSSQPEKARKLWHEAREVGTELTTFTYNLYMYMLIKNTKPFNSDSSNFNEALACWKEMKNEGIPQTNYTKSILVKLFGYMGDIKSAQSVINPSEQDFDSYSYSENMENQISLKKSFLSGIDKLNIEKLKFKPSIAKNIVNQIKSGFYGNKDVFPVHFSAEPDFKNVNIYNALIEAYCYKKDIDTAINIFNSMCKPEDIKEYKKIGLELKLIDASSQIEGVLRQTSSPNTTNILTPSPNLATFNTLVKYMCINNMHMQAVSLIELMISVYKIQPNVATFKLVITKSLAMQNFPLAAKLAYWLNESVGISPVVQRIENLLEIGSEHWQSNMESEPSNSSDISLIQNNVSSEFSNEILPNVKLA
ncbi:hypothetical protein BB559_004469 [Furculomyces boomerangus]|uniref:Pentacotripeptide-repeat region of PRORP domain-containing protein n=2 Tax=Harpellales TaxID=61421 RepID=A0A2T9YEE8_9FUNG|nr:hypothetical protein BB559_005460 [Furculomyces boomerangus]PVU90718.1 hypothetical protein BB559_004469 [Furculomyces boomerangus]PWA00035.1 hypothetical protein BB558_003920 [Smittium angustum]PWA02546.1 hypothetical protein BB558_001337 [Smittium angustum]